MPRWPGWLRHAPSLVAEGLNGVRDPLSQWLRPPAPAPALRVAAALARALLPPAAVQTPPGWLRPDQDLSFRRALAAVHRYNGALLADPVGTGKTYIALAVAATLQPSRPIQVVAPAALRAQWLEAGRRAGLEVLVHSHETLSRGRAPPRVRAAVVVDESHRLRTPTTRRYATLAPWCVGRRGLLVSATPAVNRLEDVAHQLLLFVRDDALAWGGVGSLREVLRHRAPGCLAHLVVTGEDRTSQLPQRRQRDLAPPEPEASPMEEIRRGIEALALSRDPAIAGLLRIVLLSSLASSPAAVATALRRYRSLLTQAGDALMAGRAVSRRAIRLMAGPDSEQTVLWPLLTGPCQGNDLSLADLDAVVRLERIARAWCNTADGKVTALRDLVADRRPTVVFTAATATVDYLLRHLAPSRVAWCTGTGAGLARIPAARDAVLDWFRRRTLPTDQVLARPTILVATDVASEGLDLPLVERVVHYDLPWTAVRLDQRSGRAFRLGASAASVEVVRLRPRPNLETALGRESILHTKAGLPAVLGIDSGPSAPWRLRARIAARWQGQAAIGGTAAVRWARAGVVAGFRVRSSDGTALEIVLGCEGSGWTDDPAIIAGWLDAAGEESGSVAINRGHLRAALGALSAQVRLALRNANGAGLATSYPDPGVARARRRLITLARRAARSRDADRLAALERGIALLGRGRTAGECRVVEAWEALPQQDLFRLLERLPPNPARSIPDGVELIGILLLERTASSG